MDASHPPADTTSGDWGALSRLPGNPMMWILIASELLVFGGGFVAFAGARMSDPDLFAASQDTLDRFLGGLNTLVLLSSGLFAAFAARSAGEGQGNRARLWLAAAALLGIAFLGVKAVEYGAEFSRGVDIDTNTFYTLYFLLTGFHAAHVIFGIIILGIVGVWNSEVNVETGAAFWHMVDLVWVLVYPVIYLLR